VLNKKKSSIFFFSCCNPFFFSSFISVGEKLILVLEMKEGYIMNQDKKNSEQK